MLTPVSEALSLIDVAVVNNQDWQSNPATLRRTIQILVDHVQYQSVQLSRVEDILAAYGNPTQQGGTVWSKLASKADLSRLEKLEQQLDQAMNEVSVVRAKQGEGNVRMDDCISRVELVRDQVSGLESKLGLFAGPSYPAAYPGGHGGGGSHDAAYTSPVSPNRRGGPATAGSALDRIQRLERRVDGISVANVKAEDEVASILQRLRDSEARAEASAAQLRTDLRQALGVLSANSKAEAEAEATSRVKESERRLLARVQSLEEEVENKVTAVGTRLAGHWSGELDRRVQGLNEHMDSQTNQVKGEVDRLAREKVDTTALEHYTSRVTHLFEQVASTLTEDTRGLSEQMGQKLTGLRQELLLMGAGKADKGSVQSLEEAMLREDEAMRMLGGQVRDMMSHINDSLSAQPRALDELRAVLSSSMQRTQDDMEHVQRSISGLGSAVTSTGNGLETQAQRSSSLSQKLARTKADLVAIKGVLFGSAAAVAGSGAMEAEQLLLGGGGGSGDAMSLMSRVAVMERHNSETSAQLSSKVSEAELMELGRQLAALQRQADTSSDAVRVLTHTTYKRVDEHASAIQRLTLAISSSVEDRPTASAVKNMVESACAESADRVSSALVPMWDSVRGLQGGVKELQAEVRGAAREMAGMTQQQADLRTRVSGERGALSALVRRAVDEELGGMAKVDLEPRVAALEEGHRHAKAHIEVQAQLQDRQHALTTALEDQISNQLAAARAAGTALRMELAGKADAMAGALGQRLEVLEVVTKQQQLDNQATREQLLQKVVGSEVKTIVESGCRAAAKQEVARHKEKEDGRWQVWLQQFAEALEKLVPRADVEALLQGTAKQTLRDAASYAEQRLREAMVAARAEAVQLRAHVEQRVDAACERAARAEQLAEVARERVGAAVSEAIAAAGGRAEAGVAAAEQRLRRAEGELLRRVGRPEFEAELAKKLDVRVFLANSMSAAAAVAAAAGLGSADALRAGGSAGSPSRGRQHASPRQMSLVPVAERQQQPGEGRGRGGGRPQGSAEVRRDALIIDADEEDSLAASLAAAAKLAERVKARKSAAGPTRQS